MVVLNRIYTRTGDAGDTALSDGSRVPKTDPRVEAYGTVDELNAVLGVARLVVEGEMDERLGMIQNELFDLGADLSRPGLAHDANAPYPVLRMIQGQVDRLEAEMDAMNAELDPLRSFVLPGGTPLAAHLHVARTIARRAERGAVELAKVSQGDVNPAALRYLNRLSDWLFVAARFANRQGGGDVLWVPGASRDA
ncbi:MAG: cob(I)yrinic acid a,c-diamide adenosyltransferase [Paracoccus denitrificans]|nr:MAG: cob(I)yrinic acid a,c-diamide adenosyltransferase [Paracoccus denitrificans]PZO82710.1 MAG: cob(I)yrinic acid a,c-diamide adenosyltransferase [Paracoccus denitrificans]